jgi:hypothetical protein
MRRGIPVSAVVDLTDICAVAEDRDYARCAPEAAAPLRAAGYSRLELDIEQLNEALEDSGREGNRKVWAAYMRLANTARLLDRTGWTHKDHRDSIKLDTPEDINLAQAILRDELEAENNAKNDAINDKSEHDAQAASKRELAIYDTLTALEAIAATAGLLNQVAPTQTQ